MPIEADRIIYHSIFFCFYNRILFMKYDQPVLNRVNLIVWIPAVLFNIYIYLSLSRSHRRIKTQKQFNKNITSLRIHRTDKSNT